MQPHSSALKRRASVLLAFMLLGACFLHPASADPTRTRAEFEASEWFLLLPDVQTTLDPLVATPSGGIGRGRYWTIAIISQEGGYRFLVERGVESPRGTPDLHFAEAAEDILIHDPNVATFERGSGRVTVTVDAELPKTGRWAFTAVVYNFGGCRGGPIITETGPQECTRTYQWDNVVGKFSYDVGGGDVYPITGTLGGEQIQNRYNQVNSLFHASSGWAEFFHL